MKGPNKLRFYDAFMRERDYAGLIRIGWFYVPMAIKNAGYFCFPVVFLVRFG